MRTYKTPKFEIGDRIAYSVQFLSSIGMKHSDMAAGRGIILGLKSYSDSLTLAEIEWEKSADLPQRINVFNLAKVGPNPRFCNID